MSYSLKMPRFQHHFVEMLGLRMQYRAGINERMEHVRINAVLGLCVGGLFSVFNILTPGMVVLGVVELAASIVFLLPAVVMARRSESVSLCEGLIIAAAATIFGALIVLGGIEGTGLFWVYSAPFIAFFLKGQRRGWWYSLAFVALVLLYFGIQNPAWGWVYHYSPMVRTQFLLSLCF